MVFLSAASAFAGTVSGVVSFSSNLVFPTSIPSSLRAGSQESNTTALGFVERVGLTLPSALPADLLTNGAHNYDTVGDTNPGFVAAGTNINSYFLHFDPTGFLGVGKTPGVIQIQFVPTYRIVGIQISANRLSDAANSAVAMPGVTYENRALFAYGLEISSLLNLDYIHLLDERTAQIRLNASLATIDDVRFLVQTPEPGSALLAAGALALLLWKRR